MKFFYRTLIFFFIALSLFLVRDDVVSIIDQVYSRIEKKSEIPLVQFEEKKETQLPSKVDTPGALRVVHDILNINNAKLSKDNLISLTNKEREENDNLEALKDNQLLDLTAEKKLQDMFDTQYFEHISPTGVGVGNLADDAGYEYILIGENLAMGNFNNDAFLMDAWMASAGHRANILNKNYTDIGVAVGKGNFEGKNIWMAVQHFGTPRNVCPTIDQVLLGVINLSQDKIKKEESGLLKKKEMIDNGIIYEGSTYSEQVAEYNDLIIPYNNLISEEKKQINDYNNQVRAFNLCLKKHQE